MFGEVAAKLIAAPKSLAADSRGEVAQTARQNYCEQTHNKVDNTQRYIRYADFSHLILSMSEG